MQTCPSCGEENPDRFRICGMCGAQLAAAEVVPEEVRKIVTIVFSDLKGSTALAERLDTEALREALNTYFNTMREVLEKHGGTVEKYIGDAIMAVFGLPQLHEDDALRAVRATAEMQEALVGLNAGFEETYGVRIENRTGVNTGEVVAGDVSVGHRLVTGDTVNTAARLEQNAPTMEILLGESTYRLVKDAVIAEPVEPLELKGKAERTPAYRLISVGHQEEGVARRLDAPIVGREAELKVLNDVLARAIERRRCQIVTVVAPAGTGKSRLLQEFMSRSGVRTLRGRCLSYGEGLTFWPLAEIARTEAGIGNDDPAAEAQRKLAELLGDDARDVTERIAAAIGLSSANFPVEETFWAARRFFELISHGEPLIVLIDDIHWAERTFLDLIKSVASMMTDAPIVLACSARPDLVDAHPGWGEELEDHRIVILQSLSDEDSAEVAANLLGTAELDEQVRAKIVEAAEGNPLFVEQMLSMLLDDGILARDDRGRWVLIREVGAITIPPTIQALLSARLDRLGPIDRVVVERAAVIGQVFFRGAVEDLSPDEVRRHAGESLQTLTNRELVTPHESSFAGQEAYRFMHILIREAAYHGLLKRTRAELHVRFIDWLERVASDRVLEFEEIRGYHLEQAFFTLQQLTPNDEKVWQIGVRGGGYLSSAGRRALARGDIPAAANMLQRAAALLPPGDPERPRLRLDAAEALTEQGNFDEAAAMLHAAIDEAHELSDRVLEATAQIQELELLYTVDPEAVEPTIVSGVEAHLPELETLEAHEGLARAWRLIMFVREMGLQWGESEAAAQLTLDHARMAGNRLMVARAIPSLGYCALSGPTPVPDAIERCRALLDEVHGDRKPEALLEAALSHLEAMRGNIEESRALYRKSRASLEELGWTFLAAQTSFDSGPVEMLNGDLEAAERELRRDYESLERMGETNYISTTAALLSEVLYRQGDLDGAEEHTTISEEVAAQDDVTSQFRWRGVRAKILAARGETAEGEKLAREAVALIQASDDLNSQGDAALDLAEVLRAAGRLAEAAEAADDALALYEAKGNTVSAALARATLQELSAAGVS
ncbi:MAG TPA: adenylate/guanylate cyclase domain-containing protein [Actinomycetota bacterium]|nr:adenylate/guanylate cyclase domain-containing protein [Actinomycetota bacterium]